MKEINYILLAKILSGEASQDEEHTFRDWINLSTENKKLYENYKHFYSNSEINEFEDHQIHPIVIDHKQKVNWKRLIAIAASALLIVTFAFIINNYQFSQTSVMITEISGETIFKSNPKGQKSKIMLTDGSIVWLNSESNLEYLEDFTDSLRYVRLKGEAYFEISRDTLRPFIVDAGDLKAKVLGTTFNISAYENEDQTSIALIEGKLLVSNNDREEILFPGNQIKNERLKNHMIKSSINIEDIALWKDGILTFKQDEFAEVIYKLERWYGVNFDIQGKAYFDWKFTGYFDNENLKNVLEVLSFGKNMKYEISGKNVKLLIGE